MCLKIEQNKLVRFKTLQGIRGIGKICGIGNIGDEPGIILELIESHGVWDFSYKFSHFVALLSELEEL